jgi:hypothetical protein
MKFRDLDSSVRWAFYAMGFVFLCLFIATGITIQIALKGHEPIVDPNYYEKGLNYEKTLADIRLMKQEGYSLEGSIFEERLPLQTGVNTISVQFLKNDQPITNAKIWLLRERGATFKFNQNYELQHAGEGIYTTPIDIPDVGQWVLTFHATHLDRTLSKSLKVVVQK